MNNDTNYIGIDIGGSHTKVALVTNNYEIINEDNVFYGNIEPNSKPSYIYEHITKYIDNLSKEIFDNIKGIAVACPGIAKENQIIGAVNLGGTSDILIKIQEKYNIPLYSTNDAVAASFAQFKKGSLMGTANAIYFGLGTGVGFSVILNKEILLPNGLPVDLSHTSYLKNNIKCSCGKDDCIEKYISIKALRTKLNDRINKKYNTNDNLKIEIILERYDIKDYEDILSEYANNIVTIIINQIELFKPDKVCLGGGFVKISNSIIFTMIKDKYENSKIFSTLFNYNKPEIIISKKLNCSEIVGATLLLEDNLNK
jgi:N-acetylmannosamine kinase